MNEWTNGLVYLHMYPSHFNIRSLRLGILGHLSFILNSYLQFNSVQSLSRVWLFATPWIAACQASLSITNSWVHSNSCPSSRWCHPTISSSVAPFSSCPQSFLASGSFPVSPLYASGGQSTRVSALASVLPRNIQGWFPMGLAGLISLLFKDSQESSTSQFESINSSELSLLYGPTLTSIHDSWKKHSFDYMDLCQQEWCLCFLICCINRADSWGPQTPEFLHQPPKPALCCMSQIPIPAGPSAQATSLPAFFLPQGWTFLLDYLVMVLFFKHERGLTLSSLKFLHPQFILDIA